MTHSAKVLFPVAGIPVVSLLAIMSLSSLSNAQVAGSIAIWAEPRLGICETDDAPGQHTVYVVNWPNAGTTAARFKIEPGPGFTMTYLSEVHYLASTVGNTQDGISVCYETCRFDPVVIASITYIAYGTSSSCSRLRVVPHPAAETIETIHCQDFAQNAWGEDLTIHLPGGGCGCPVTHRFSGTPQLFSCSPVAVESATWGAIKALYR